MTKAIEHLALYRKYRPASFRDVLGQDHVVKVLEGAIKLENISHAYLFAGSRGTGKTSVARIFAKEIGTSSNDLYEIDAASNRGIDDVRQLREAVNTMPFESKYKVYIIDEVHMLTKEAFNALLKTLEEPPKHVIFILATTEMEKLPETIISRCQTFAFKKPSHEVLKELVIAVAKKEGFTLEPASGDLIALLADGSFRDAQGILQKVISGSKDKKISLGEVETVTGAPREKLLNSILEAVDKSDLSSALSEIGKASDAGVDMKVLLALLTQKTRQVLLLRYSKDSEKRISEETPKETFELLKSISQNNKSPVSSKLLLEFLQSNDLIGFSPVPELPIELALMKILGQNQ